MLPSRLQVMAAAIGGILAIAALPAFVSASDEVLVTIPVSGVHRGPEGTSAQVASAAVPAELVGQRCEIFGSTVNQRSVHPGNDLLIVNGDESFVIPDFEDEGDIVHDAGDVETISSTIQLFVIFGPDGVSSGGFRVTIRNCVDPTETTLSSTTTVPVTTVPDTEGPSTTVPSTEPEPTVPGTDAQPPTTAITTTAAPTTVAPSTAPPTTEQTTSSVAEPAGPVVSSTTVAPETTQAPTSAAPDPLGPTAGDGELPVTGSSTWLIAGFGAAVVAGGSALVAFGRRDRAIS